MVQKRPHDPDATPSPKKPKPTPKRPSAAHSHSPSPSPAPSPSASPSPSPIVKLEIKSEPNSDDDSSASKPKAKKGKSKAKSPGGQAEGRKWTPAEIETLFRFAMPKIPRKAWEGVVQGRTALQCDRAWKRVPGTAEPRGPRGLEGQGWLALRGYEGETVGGE